MTPRVQRPLMAEILFDRDSALAREARTAEGRGFGAEPHRDCDLPDRTLLCAMARVLSCAAIAVVLGASAPALAQGYGQPSPYGQPQQPYAPHGSQPSNQPGSLQAGGLTAPGAAEPEPDPSSVETERELRKAEDEDAGRGLEWFYVNAEVGAEHLGLQTFKSNDLVDSGFVETTQTGFLLGAGLGLRLVFVTIGPRFRWATFSAWQLWTLDGEIGIRIPIGSVEPYFVAGAGYASIGSFSGGNLGGGLTAQDVSVTGYNIRGGGGIDFYVTPVFSIGAGLTFEILGLSRPGVDPARLQSTQDSGDPDVAARATYDADGSSLGSGLTGTLVLGLHF
jgi:hypothetical protein